MHVLNHDIGAIGLEGDTIVIIGHDAILYYN
jgi:hypothetical protein